MPPLQIKQWDDPPDPTWGELPTWPRPPKTGPASGRLARLYLGDGLCDWGEPLAPRDGWRIANRIDRRVRRPGAHTTNRDYFLIATFQAQGITSPFTDPRIADKLLDWKERLNDLKRAAKDMEAALQGVVSGRIELPYRLHNEMIGDEWNVYWHARHGAWFSYLRLRDIEGSPWRYHDTQREELDRLFEKDAAPWDFRHRRILALSGKLARVVLGRYLRRAVAQRAIALYWQEQTQRALCAPDGAGRAADRGAFESEFA